MWLIVVAIFFGFYLGRSALQDEDLDQLHSFCTFVLLVLGLQMLAYSLLLMNPRYLKSLTETVSMNGFVAAVYVAKCLFVLGFQILLAFVPLRLKFPL